jgi:hypothetical protein
MGKAKRMSESVWDECTDPHWMLDYLYRKFPKLDAKHVRKKRLFGCACCRRVQHLLTDQRCLDAIDLAEKLADGEVTKDDCKEARSAARAAAKAAYAVVEDAGPLPSRSTQREIAYAAWSAADAIAQIFNVEVGPLAATAASAMVHHPRRGRVPTQKEYAAAQKDEDKIQAAFLRDLFGNPFRRVVLDSAWLKRNGGVVPKMARGIYDDRRLDDLPVLADALEDAGCDNEEILAHCRQPGEHVRGCWVVDLLLGKG